MKITSSTGSPFYEALKEKTNNYFSNKKRTGNLKLFIKAAIIVLVAITLYFLPFFVSLSFWAYILTRALSGLNMSFIGFNIGHDALHGSFSEKKWINRIMGLSFDISGVSSYFWNWKHNKIHHYFTNTEEDNDIETNKVMRLAPFQKWFPVYRFQVIYGPILYCIEHLYWFFADFKKLKNNCIGHRKIPKKIGKKDLVIFWFGKLFFLFKSLLVPIMFFGIEKGIWGFIALEIVCGFSLSIVFQLAHVQRKSQFFVPNQANIVEEEWAVQQVKTTADFETWNPVLSWFLGGLNFQTIHHLFPKVSHIHYRPIQKLVVQNCKELKIPYNHFEVMLGAFISHIHHLWKMGQEPKLAQ